MFLKIDILDIQKNIQKKGADNRIVKIFSSLPGQISKGLNSFLYRICEAISESYPDGVTFSEMKGFQSKKQKCQIKYEGGENWDQRQWPLEWNIVVKITTIIYDLNQTWFTYELQ